YLLRSGDDTNILRYWTLPVEPPFSFRNAGDYIENFRELMTTAVRDRVRTSRVAVFMSGGLDSSSLAATTREILEQRSAPYDLRAYTVVFDRLIPDEERHFAGLTAKALGIPIHFFAGDD